MKDIIVDSSNWSLKKRIEVVSYLLNGGTVVFRDVKDEIEVEYK